MDLAVVRAGWTFFKDWLFNWRHKRRGLADLRIWPQEESFAPFSSSSWYQDGTADRGDQNALNSSAMFLTLTSRNYLRRTIAEAQHKEADIVSEIPPPMDSEGHADAVGQSLSRAQFSVHFSTCS